MSMHLRIVGFHPPDQQWKAMKAVWDSCKAAGVAVPHDVEKFFNYTPPDDLGVQIDLTHVARPYRDDCADGYEVDVSKLPEGVSVVRFFCSY